MNALAGIDPAAYPFVAEALKDRPDLAYKLQVLTDGAWSNFVPRPNRPDLFDEQEGFVNNRDLVAFLVGGNAAGTTSCACLKTAKFLLQQQRPPRYDTPFWIISNTYEQVCDVVWKEKLLGRGFIPECEIDSKRISWLDQKAGHPQAVPLKPWPKEKGGRSDRNWKIEFKSFEQGRQALQAKSIGGFFFSEQFPLDIFLETLRGCRDYMFPGGQFSEFTPIDPELSLWVEKAMEAVPEGWRFYRCNTSCNKANLADGWFDSFFSTIPEEMVGVRMTGELASFEGAIYQSFNRQTHVIPEPIKIPNNVIHYRGIDWGASEEHPFYCCWGFRDGIGDWTIYDEYWNNSQSMITADHVAEILRKSVEWGWPIHKNAERTLSLAKAFRVDDPNDLPELFLRDNRVFDSPLHCETFADPSRPGEINEFNTRGIPTYPASNDVYKGIDCIRALLRIQPSGQPKLRISARCIHLIDSLRKYRWKRGRKAIDGHILNPEVAKPVPMKRADDEVDGMRYMIFSAERSRGVVPGSTTYRDYEKKHGIQIDLQPKQNGRRRSVLYG